MAIINTGAIERNITGVNESDLFLDESTSTVNNTGAVEREIEASHDANFVHPLGDELVINGGFDSDSDWIKFGSWAISEGVASFDNDLSGASNIIQEIDSLESGKSYRLSFDVLEANGGNLLLKIGAAGGVSFTTLSSVQPNTSYSINIPFSSTTKKLFLRGSATFAGSLDNVSLKELLVNRESTVTNTGAARRSIEGINESDLFLNESSSNVNNTGTIERSVSGVNESDTF